MTFAACAALLLIVKITRSAAGSDFRSMTCSAWASANNCAGGQASCSTAEYRCTCTDGTVCTEDAFGIETCPCVRDPNAAPRPTPFAELSCGAWTKQNNCAGNVRCDKTFGNSCNCFEQSFGCRETDSGATRCPCPGAMSCGDWAEQNKCVKGTSQCDSFRKTCACNSGPDCLSDSFGIINCPCEAGGVDPAIIGGSVAGVCGISLMSAIGVAWKMGKCCFSVHSKRNEAAQQQQRDQKLDGLVHGVAQLQRQQPHSAPAADAYHGAAQQPVRNAMHGMQYPYHYNYPQQPPPHGISPTTGVADAAIDMIDSLVPGGN